MQNYQLFSSCFCDIEAQIETIVIFEAKIHAQGYRGPFSKKVTR